MMTSHHFCHLVKLITELKRITSRNELVIHTLIYIENSLEGGTGKVGTIWASLFLLLMWLHGVNLLFFCFEKKKKNTLLTVLQDYVCKTMFATPIIPLKIRLGFVPD